MEIKNRFITGGILVVLAGATIACFIPEVISANDAIATEVSTALEEVLEETAAAAPTYTPYPTYTPVPTYTPNPYLYPFNRPEANNNHLPPMQER